ncbi:uncharacterized protein LOC121997513 isoform X2 [Zingiber officinale]|uniref:uncharacterized protein LOC121997513 isoform X2 n=1 Tax=Zingiber officinale TaxID=94328 RepID=UPI001C4C33F1|nr:uncharacterized protein LOC121997513 isoform X2 [Zingiber officinale]
MPMPSRKESVNEEIPTASSLGDALLYTTMCIVGLPVEVQVKDGSLYCGILHTACFEKDHGVVLKKATKVGKGKCLTNLALGDCVDTLIVLSSDLVQVVVKGFILPAEGVVDRVSGKSAESVNHVESHSCSREIESEEKGSTFHNSDASRQDTGCQADGDKEENPIFEVAHGAPSSPIPNSNGRNSDLSSLPVRLATQESEASKASISSDTRTSVCSSDTTTTNSCANGLVPSNTTIPKKIKAGSIITKESKLNPGAKDFTPSTANFRQALAPVPRLISPSQMSNSLSMVPAVGAQLGNEMNSLASRLTVPSKVVPYNNLIVAQPGNGTNYSRPIMGNSSIRQLPVRVNSQYHPLQSGHVYLNPHSQMVPAGPLNMPVYLHPFPQEHNSCHKGSLSFSFIKRI